MPSERALPPQGRKLAPDLGRRHFDLAALVAELRQASGAYVLTSVAHGARSEGRQRTLQRLQRLGVFEQPAPGAGALAAAAPAFIVVKAGNTAAGRAGPVSTLLVIADPPAVPRLSMSEQRQLRDAQRHLALPASCRIVLGTGMPSAAGGRGDDGWIEISSMSN